MSIKFKEALGIILVVAGSLFIADAFIEQMPPAPCEKTQSC